VERKQRLILVAAGAAVLCGAAVWYLVRGRGPSLDSPRAMLRHLPAHDSVLLYADVAALRRAGVLKTLAGSKVENEYLDFVRRSGFDYTRDLDAVLMVLRPTGKFAVVKGRFDWNKMRSYVQQQGGACAGQVCRVAGSAPDRKISFYQLGAGALALAVSADDSAALQITSEPQASAPAIEIPSDPVWVALPPDVLHVGTELPPGTRMFARALASAESAVLGFGAEGKGIAARLAVRCRKPEDAATLSNQLQAATTLLRGMLEREKKAPNARDLSGVLAGGSFRNQGEHVYGAWTIPQEFVSEVLGGSQ